MTDTKDLIREIQEHTAKNGGENTATHLLVQAVMALQRQADEMAAIGAGGVSGPLLGGALRTQAQPAGDELGALFREALAWGMAYGPAIPAHQWDDMRESMVSQYVSRAALAAQAPQPGYVLVPLEPTPNMLNDAVKAFNEATASLGVYSAPEAAYRAMLAAAPKAPQPGYVLVPVEPEQKYLRPFHSCPPEELELAWQAMVTVARVAAPKAPQQAAPAVASKAVLAAIRDANLQLVRTGEDTFMLVILKQPAPQQEVPATTTAVHAACGKIIQTLAEIVNAPQTDAHFDAEVVPRNPLMNRVQDIKAQVDAIYKLHPVNGAAPQQEVQEPFGYVNTQTGQFFKDVEACRKNNEGHWRTIYTAQPAPSGDAARELFDAGWKSCARFCDREDAAFDGIVGGAGCPEFEAAFNAARKEGK
ncbi:hypothetical protein [Acidovorax sp. RAC01]|uniref:hypothetical protein n=1 Tax=Acidovorax sp. RAC01 TaxID=1842533 RepID=UPI00083E82FD|nr:hypothetical protein [Acidovorax sp. RAC01]AOG22053.1 hypothetical protein BSY15_3863 [Acidovorax sp. RAC01]AOG24516.1 hypothetical protein BSY15_3786 [Acidovorax sp. RAC01]